MAKRSILIILFFGLIFRIFIAFYNYSGDVPVLIKWGEHVFKYGPSGFYEKNFGSEAFESYPNYPPLAIYLFTLSFALKNWVFNFAWFLNSHLSVFPSQIIFFLKSFDYLPFLIKLPAICADIGIATLTYLIVKNNSKDKKTVWPLVAALLVALNPAYFYNSAIWGQTDSIPIFFILAAFYTLIFNKKMILSAGLFTLAILVKQTAVLFLPLYLLTYYFYLTEAKKPLVNFFYTLLSSFSVFWLFFLPFYKGSNYLTGPFEIFASKIVFASGIPYTSNHAFNLWYTLTGSRKVPAADKFIFNQSYNFWGYLFVILIAMLILLKFYMDRSIKTKGYFIQSISQCASLISLTSFLFLTKMHERHLILTLPFLLLLVHKNRLFLFAFIYISLFNFLNMYHDWWSPNIKFLMSILSNIWIIKILIVGIILIYLFLLKQYFLPVKNHKVG